MIGECKDYLANKLRDAGVQEVYTEAEQSQKHHSLPYALVMTGPEGTPGRERLEYSPRRVAMEDDRAAGVRRIRLQTHIRQLQLRVAIVHRTEAEAEAVLTSFLEGLDRRFLDRAGNAVLVYCDMVERSDEGSLLRNQSGAEAVVFFQGGVYRDYEVPLFSVPQTMSIEADMTKEV